MEPLGDFKVKTDIDLSPFPIKEEPNVDSDVEEDMKVLTDLQQNASEWKMDCSLRPEQSLANHSRYDPEKDHWRSHIPSVNNDRESRSYGDESEKYCKTFCLNASSPSRDIPPEFEKVFVKVEDVYASDVKPVEQKFWIEEPSVGQESQPGCSSWSDEVDYQRGRDLHSTTVNSKGDSHQHKEFAENRSGACDSTLTNYSEALICRVGSEKDCKTAIPCSNTNTLNNTLTIDEVYECGFEQKEYHSVSVGVLDKETKTSTMEQVDKEMLVATRSTQSITQNSSKKKNYVCIICDFETPTLKIYKDHMMKDHSEEKSFLCEFCDYKCSDIANLNAHQRKHTGEKPFHCEFCDYKCSHSSYLKVHGRIHTGEKPYNCKFCDYKCSRSSDLLHHERNHTGDKRFHCEFCDFKCSQRSSLKLHVRYHTGEKPYQCQFCDYKCAHSSYLNVHERKHTGEKPYHCELCDYKCSQPSHLKAHEKIHAGEKQYQCEFCGLKFSSSSALKVHERTHTGVKPYHCQFCDFKSSQCSSLKRHEKAHAREKPYQCKFCDLKLSSSSSLKVHERTHTGEYPYHCEFCDYKCSHPSQLKRHKKTHR